MSDVYFTKADDIYRSVLSVIYTKKLKKDEIMNYSDFIITQPLLSKSMLLPQFQEDRSFSDEIFNFVSKIFIQITISYLDHTIFVIKVVCDLLMLDNS